MSNTSQWSVTAASNNDAPPDGAPEGMAPSTVNDSAREVMAALKRFWDELQGALITGGSGNAYTLTTPNATAALADQALIVFQVDRANTGTSTLDVDGLGAKTIHAKGLALVSGDLILNVIHSACYNATTDVYDLVSGKSSISNADWSGTALAVANGGTGSTTATAARAALAAAANTLSGVDFNSLVALQGNALAPTDDFLVMDGTVAKRIEYTDAGVPINSVSGTSDTLATADMNTFIEYTNAGAVAVTLNTGVGVAGNYVVIQQDGAGQVTVSGTATFDSAVGEKTRLQNSVIILVNKGSDVWAVYGDTAA